MPSNTWCESEGIEEIGNNLNWNYTIILHKMDSICQVVVFYWVIQVAFIVVKSSLAIMLANSKLNIV